MNKSEIFAFITIMTSGFILAGCATPGAVDRGTIDSTIGVEHGTVVDIEQVDLTSNVARNSTIGGLAGLAARRHGSTNQQIGGAVAGALIAGLVTKATEGSNQANAYTVQLNNGSFRKIITENSYIRIGDCVAVETGKTSNIRDVSRALCEPAAGHPVDREIHAHRQEEASECHDAKKQLLDATTGKEVDAIARKVKVLCEH